MGSVFIIRDAIPSDAKAIFDFIVELAIYEKAEDQVLCTEKMIHDSLFAEGATAKAIVCENDLGKVTGYAIYFYNYSTWLAKKGLYLEDLYVTETERGVGAGKKLITYLAALAVKEGCGRFEWSVLDWNTPAIDFYESLGAKPQSEWTVYRLTGKPLEVLAATYTA